MNSKDISALMKGIAPAVREYVVSAIEPLAKRIVELERQVDSLESGGLKFVGVYQRALRYPKGSAATLDGALWVSLRDAQEGEQPGRAPMVWQLAVKAGG